MPSKKSKMNSEESKLFLGRRKCNSVRSNNHNDCMCYVTFKSIKRTNQI